MIEVIVGGVLSAVLCGMLTMVFGSLGGIGSSEVVISVVIAALPGMLVGAVLRLGYKQDELKEEIRMLRERLAWKEQER